MGRPKGADRAIVRTRITEFIQHHAGTATQPELRRHLVAELHISDRFARHLTAEILRGPGFLTEPVAVHRGPRTIRVRLAPPRRRLDP